MAKVMQRNRLLKSTSSSGLYFKKFYPLLFFILAINPVYLSIIPHGLKGSQPYLYFPIVLCLVLLVLPAFKEYELGAINAFHPVIRIIWGLLILWSIFTVFHGIKLGNSELIYLFGRKYGAGAWLAPLVMLAGAQPFFWKNIFTMFIFHTKIGVTIGFVFVALFLTGHNFISYRVAHSFVYAAGFLVLCLPFRNHRLLILAFLGCSFSSFYGFLRTARNQIIKNFNYVFLFCCKYLLSKRERFAGQKVMIILISVVLMVAVYQVVVNSAIPVVLQSSVNAMQEKMYKNTRSNMFEEFIQVSSNMEILLGRGAIGSYHSRLIKGTYNGKRLVVENGYFQIILKGGIIMLVLIMSLALSAAYMGIFKSQNLFTKGCGMFVLARLIEMIPYGIPKFDGEYLLFWLAVGACLSKSIRENKMEPVILR